MNSDKLYNTTTELQLRSMVWLRSTNSTGYECKLMKLDDWICRLMIKYQIQLVVNNSTGLGNI